MHCQLDWMDTYIHIYIHTYICTYNTFMWSWSGGDHAINPSTYWNIHTHIYIQHCTTDVLAISIDIVDWIFIAMDKFIQTNHIYREQYMHKIKNKFWKKLPCYLTNKQKLCYCHVRLWVWCMFDNLSDISWNHFVIEAVQQKIKYNFSTWPCWPAARSILLFHPPRHSDGWVEHTGLLRTHW